MYGLIIQTVLEHCLLPFSPISETLDSRKCKAGVYLKQTSSEGQPSKKSDVIKGRYTLLVSFSLKAFINKQNRSK